jgi:CubicO group peptidase (beta-lactamase class C family)
MAARIGWMPRVAVMLGLSIAVAAAPAGEVRGAPARVEIETGLEIELPGSKIRRTLDLPSALELLKVPSVSVALIDGERLAWAHAWGAATPDTLYQAASLSKLVTAVAALRLVEAGRLGLDRNVNDDLGIWRAPDNSVTAGHPVTLRGLLSMTAGIGVPGYVGYAPGSPLPDLQQILNGTPPALSAPVRVVAVPGSRYAYSGGGYEIVQALIEAKTGVSFEAALRDLVLRPAGMQHSTFAQPLPASLALQAATGHYGDGRELPGGWRVVPELAAGGLWSTPRDLANLLIEIARAYRGAGSVLLRHETAVEMLTRQNGGPYGLGGSVGGAGQDLVLMKRGQNVGYQSYMLIFPRTGQGMVVMTNSDNGTALASALIRRAAAAYGWPALGRLAD